MKKRLRLIQWLNGFVDSLKDGNHRVIITSRPVGNPFGELGSSFEHFDLLPFSNSQVLDLIHELLGEDQTRFLAELNRIQAGNLLGTPLLITVAALVYRRDGTLPSKLTDLYYYFIHDIFLSEPGNWPSGIGLSDGFQVLPELQVKRLAFIAYRVTACWLEFLPPHFYLAALFLQKYEKEDNEVLASEVMRVISQLDLDQYLVRKLNTIINNVKTDIHTRIYAAALLNDRAALLGFARQGKELAVSYLMMYQMRSELRSIVTVPVFLLELGSMLPYHSVAWVKTNLVLHTFSKLFKIILTRLGSLTSFASLKKPPMPRLF